MQVRGNRRRRGLDRGFVLSDHADWPGLLAAIEATGAERVFATHGSVGAADAIPAGEGPRRAGACDRLWRRGRRRRSRLRPRRAVRAFADLYRRLDSATSTRAKQAALIDAFAAARDDPSRWASAAWMVYFLAGGKPRQTVPTHSCGGSRSKVPGCPNGCARSATRASAISPRRWRCCCREGVGGEEISLDVWMRERLLPLPALDEEEKIRDALRRWVDALARGRRGSSSSSSSPANCGSACLGCRSSRRSPRSRGVERKPDGAAHDRLRPGATDPGGRGFRGADRGGRRMRKALALDAGRPYPFYLAQSWQRAGRRHAGDARPAGELDRRMEIRRHSRATLKRGESWRLWSRGEELDLRRLSRSRAARRALCPPASRSTANSS